IAGTNHEVGSQSLSQTEGVDDVIVVDFSTHMQVAQLDESPTFEFGRKFSNWQSCVGKFEPVGLEPPSVQPCSKRTCARRKQRLEGLASSGHVVVAVPARSDIAQTGGWSHHVRGKVKMALITRRILRSQINCRTGFFGGPRRLREPAFLPRLPLLLLVSRFPGPRPRFLSPPRCPWRHRSGPAWQSASQSCPPAWAR